MYSWEGIPAIEVQGYGYDHDTSDHIQEQRRMVAGAHPPVSRGPWSLDVAIMR